MSYGSGKGKGMIPRRSVSNRNGHKKMLRYYRPSNLNPNNKKKVKCEKTLSLIKKGLKCGVIDLKVFIETKRRTPQGSILSPLLCNIYLHELDTEMYRLKKDFSSPNNYKRRKNPLYRKIQYLKEKSGSTGELRKLAILQRQIHSKDPMDEKFRKLFFIRY